jgi:hypothetical protein
MRIRVLFHSVFAAGALAASAARADTALDEARARWSAAALTEYEYGYHKFCECHREAPPETVVTVRAGSVVGVRHRLVGSTNEVPAADRNLEYYWTVEELFDLIASAQSRGVEVRASYDAELGFPRELYIDYDVGFIGDELDLRLTSVTRLGAPVERDGRCKTALNREYLGIDR